MKHKFKNACIFCGECTHKWKNCHRKPTSQCEHVDHKSRHCSLTLLEKFYILEHDIHHNRLHKPKSWVDDFQISLGKALHWFHHNGNSLHNTYLHVSLIEELQTKTQQLHECLKVRRFLKKVLRAWHTQIETGHDGNHD